MSDGGTAQRLAQLEEAFRRLVLPEKPAPSLGQYIGQHQALPVLRGFWPMSSIDSSNQVIDLSAQDRTLAWTSTVNRGIHNELVPYSEFNGSSSFLSRADEVGTSITGHVTIGGWFWFDIASADQCMITKWLTTGNQRSYGMNFANSGDQAQFFVSSNGTAVTTVTGSTVLTTGRWYHIVGRYFSGTSLTVFVDGEQDGINTTSIPASIFDSTATFRIGALGDGSQFLDGRATMCFLLNYPLESSLIKRLYVSGRQMFQ